MMQSAATAKRYTGDERHPKRPHTATSNSPRPGIRRRTGPISNWSVGPASHPQEHSTPPRVRGQEKEPLAGNWPRYTGRERASEPQVGRIVRGGEPPQRGCQPEIPQVSSPSASPRTARRRPRNGSSEPIETPPPTPQCGGRNSSSGEAGDSTGTPNGAV